MSKKPINLSNAQILSALPAFEAAARHGSFTRAADELGITQGAISRRVQALETSLGVVLFSRRGRSLAITADGRQLARSALEAIDLVERTKAGFGNPVSGTVRVGVLPSLGSLWLAPRLPIFMKSHPSIVFSVKTIDADFQDSHKDPVNWDPSTLDVVMTWGSGGWRSLSVYPFSHEYLVPVCSAEFLELHAINDVKDLWQVPRLIHTTRFDTWRAYGDRFGVSMPTRSGRDATNPEFEHFFMMVEAVRAGLGVALMPHMLVDEDLASGRLIACAPTFKSGWQYALVTSDIALSRPGVSEFIDWVVEAGVAQGIPASH